MNTLDQIASEVGLIVKNEKMLDVLNAVFLIDDVEKTDDYIKGFCDALFYTGYLNSELDADKLAILVKEHRILFFNE